MKYQPKRLFTLDEANRMLPLIERITTDIQATYERVAERYRWLPPSESERIDAQRREELRDAYAELERDRQRLIEYVGELEQLGVELKGPQEGLVDFPSLRDGRIVYLCWKLGENQIGHWHELDAGFRGRQPLEPAAESRGERQRRRTSDDPEASAISQTQSNKEV